MHEADVLPKVVTIAPFSLWRNGLFLRRLRKSEGKTLKEIDQSWNPIYKGSTRFSFESLLEGRKSIGDDFVTRRMVEETQEKFQGTVIDKGSVPEAAVYYSALRGLSKILEPNIFDDFIAFTDQLLDPETYADFLGTLGISVENGSDMSDLEPQKLAASIAKRPGRMMETSADRCFFLVYFPSKEMRDQAFDAFKDQNLIDPLMMYPYEELSGDPEDKKSESMCKVLEFSLPRRRTETAEESNSRARSLLEKVVGPSGYLRFSLH